MFPLLRPGEAGVSEGQVTGDLGLCLNSKFEPIHFLMALVSGGKGLIHVVSLRQPCPAFEKGPYRCRPRQTANRPRPYHQPSTSRGSSQHSTPTRRTRGRLPLHRVQSHYQSSPPLVIPRKTSPTSPDHPKSRLGRRHTEQRG